MNKRLVAVDYGKKRIGLAITDPRGVVALPLTVVSSGKSLLQSVRAVLKALSPYLAEVKELIVGLPLLLKGTAGEMAKEVEQFAEILRQESQRPVVLFDERLSSKAAERALLEMGHSRRERKEKSDATAATLLLQTYLSTIA